MQEKLMYKEVVITRVLPCGSLEIGSELLILLLLLLTGRLKKASNPSNF
jgi:hypothetical protein